MCIHVGLDLLIVLWYGRPRTLNYINNTYSAKHIVLNRIEKDSNSTIMYNSTNFSS